MAGRIVMWPFDHSFSTYTWPGLFGWVARNTPGNLVASAIAFAAGYLVKGRQIVRDLHAKLDAHHAEQMRAHAVTHDAVSGDGQ